MLHRFLSALSPTSYTWGAVMALVILTNLCASPCDAAPNDGFTTDVKAAIEEALEQDKDILLLFTGSDWCPPCKKLESEVFSQQEFLDGVSRMKSCPKKLNNKTTRSQQSLQSRATRPSSWSTKLSNRLRFLGTRTVGQQTTFN